MPNDTLSTTLAAVADPTRRAILARLRHGEATVGELAAPFAMSLPAVSKHLGVLERAGLLTRSREAQRRPCRLRPEGLREAADWLLAFRALWEARLDRLEDLLAELQRTPAPVRRGCGGGKRSRSRHRTPRPQ
jgi:DNA-binding transcriptional ArsR family regulator